MWNAEETQWHIGIKELETVRRAIGRMKPGTKALVSVDNTCAYWSLMRGRAFSWDLNDIVRRIGGDVKARGLGLSFRWVSTTNNLADSISRATSRVYAFTTAHRTAPPH
jgi:hypothetical protein